MRILHKFISFLGFKQNDEEIERRTNPYQTLDVGRQKCYTGDDISSRNFYERFRKIVILCFQSLFYNGLKGLLQKFFFLSRRKNRAEPVLPIVNPSPSIENVDPLLVQPLLISSPDLDSSESEDVEEFMMPQCVDIDVVSSHQWPEENCPTTINQRDYSLVSIPEEEIAQQPNVPHREERQREVDVKVVVVVDEVRWIKHYSSSHRILLVGEGDFSFSASLAVAFCQASNMIATSLDSKEFLEKNYSKAPSNIQKLKNRGCIVMHGIDATKMANNSLLAHLTFDRIIFNFPFAGFFKDLSRKSQLRRHRTLVSRFMKNAKEMISRDGEIHISHKTNEFHSEWKLESMASSHKLKLIEAINFQHRDYPGYHTKCGFGSDNNFNCNPSKTYKFGLKG